MRLNNYYENHVREYLQDLDMNFLQGKTVMITGATGMIGSALADMLCMANKDIRVLGTGRSCKRASSRFAYPWFSQNNFSFIEHDVVTPCSLNEHIDYIVHAASPAYPAVYSQYPVETMTANFIGTLNLLQLAKQKKARFMFLSSGEVYGDISGEVKHEDDYGYIDTMQTRSSYPNSKRAAETLCVAFREEYSVDTLVVRLSHVYGPTMTESDNRVSSEFIRNVKEGKALVMRSKGNTVRSYTYVMDAVAGIICALKKGKSGEVYNIADEHKVVSIRQMAEIVAKVGGISFKIDIPSTVDKGASPILRQVMSGTKLRALGWKCKYDFSDGIYVTLRSIDTV